MNELQCNRKSEKSEKWKTAQIKRDFLHIYALHYCGKGLNYLRIIFFINLIEN